LATSRPNHRFTIHQGEASIDGRLIHDHHLLT